MARRQRSSSTGHLNLNSRAGGAAGTFLITLLLVVAIGVFAYSGWRLFNYYMAYKQGSDEYSDLNDEYMNTPAQTAVPQTDSPTEETPCHPANPGDFLQSAEEAAWYQDNEPILHMPVIRRCSFNHNAL